jgi:transposase-like protein
MEPMGITTPSSAFGCLTDAVKKQYEARKNTDGSIIYVFTGFPTHYACPSCFAKNTRQVLQFRRVGSGYFACPGCKTFFPVTPAPMRSHYDDVP